MSSSGKRNTCARLIARMLHGYGVTHVFFMDAILRRVLAEADDLGIIRVLGHTEKGVAYMADGYARVSGRPAVCMAQSVGAANLAAGMQDAYLGQSPVIAITGRQPDRLQYRNTYQELPHEPMFGAVTKSSARVESPEQVVDLLRRAFREATVGTPRPVHLDVDGLAGDWLASMEARDEPVVDDAHVHYPAYRPRPDPDSIARAAAQLGAARRPVLVADRGMTISGAGAALRALAEHADVPVVATLDAREAMLERERWFRGLVGLYGHSCANRTVAEADLVVYVGSAVSDHTTAGWKLPPRGTPVIQIDIDAAEIGRNYPALGIHADVRAALEALKAASAQQKRDDWISRTQGHIDEWRRAVTRHRTSDAVPIRPERLCADLADALPRDAILVADTGFAAMWTASHVELRHRGQTYLRAAGSLGWAFPASLGAKCAAPDRPVVAFIGDGGFHYHLSELDTACRLGLPTVTVVNNNSGLAQAVRNLTIAHEGRPSLAGMEELHQFGQIDFAQVARGYGAIGLTVTRPERFREAFESALAADQPVVIDVKTDLGAQADAPWVPE